MQNFALGEFSVLQDPHRRVNGDAHSSQNFALSGVSAPHLEQRTAVNPTPIARKTVQTKPAPSDVFARWLADRLEAAGKQPLLVMHPEAGHRVLFSDEITARSALNAHDGTDAADRALGLALEGDLAITSAPLVRQRCPRISTAPWKHRFPGKSDSRLMVSEKSGFNQKEFLNGRASVQLQTSGTSSCLTAH
jgi:hypothetical protein